jgi:hypothetical protein
LSIHDINRPADAGRCLRALEADASGSCDPWPSRSWVTDDRRTRQLVRFNNRTQGDWILVVEPWAQPYVVPPGLAVTLEYEDPEDLQIEFTVQQDGVSRIGVRATTLKITLGDKVVFEMGGQ